MADTAFGPGTPDSRVAMLEEIAKATKEALGDIRAELLGLRSEFDDMRKDSKARFRWLLSFIIAGHGSLLGLYGVSLGLMTHGFHWL